MTEVGPRYAELLGAEVLAVDGRPVPDVIAALDPLLTRDNEFGPLAAAPARLRQPHFLHAVGAAENPNKIMLAVRLAGGTRTDVPLVAEESATTPFWRASGGLPGALRLPETRPGPLPEYLREPDRPYRFTHLPGDGLVYFQFNGIGDEEGEPLHAFHERLFRVIDERDVPALVLDMRWNGGGNTFLALPLVHRIIAHPRINRRGHLFVIIGRHTFSAAQNTVTLLDRHAHPVFVGEPTGSAPNFIGETVPFRLPYSGVRANISDLYWQTSRPFDRRVAIAPHLYAPPTFEAYRANRDPAMEAIRHHLASRVDGQVLTRLPASDGDVGMRVTTTNETSLVVAARAGDPRATDELVTAYLPFVYTLVRRALSGHPDVDDVVQETMLRALRELRGLRAPGSFRQWLVAIAMRQISTYLRRQHLATGRTVAQDELIEVPGADFERLALLRLDLSDQRRQVVLAGRWLDPDDRVLLSLWWLEVAGQLTRTEMAAGLRMSVAHAGVRVQRMRRQLELGRSLVAALSAGPRCARLSAAVAEWDGRPSPLWRKRIARHTRSCAGCARAAEGLVPPERLLVGVALLPVPAALAAAVIGESAVAGTAGSAGAAGAIGAGVKAGLLGQLVQAIATHPVAAAVTAGTLAAGVAVTTAVWPTREPQVVAAPPSAPAAIVAPISAPPVVARWSWARPPAPPARERPSPTVAPPPAPASSGLPLGRASLESVNGVGLVMTTADSLGVLERVGAESDPPARERATFEVVPGLADPTCRSFRAQDGRYLRHLSWRLRLSQDEGTGLFRADATFCPRAGSTPGSVSLSSANYPDAFLRHRGNELWVDWPDGTAAFPADASFLPRPPLAG